MANPPIHGVTSESLFSHSTDVLCLKPDPGGAAVVRAIILTIGREILRGRVQDTNSWTIARRLTGLGIPILRITVCDDDVEAVAREVTRAAGDGAGLVIATGGLGPTDDDLTLEGLAQATGRPVALDPAARRMVAERYVALARSGAVDDAALTPPREKMARIPRGSTPLPNPVGAAPGVWLEIGPSVHIALPGVPPEMIAILEASVLPMLASKTGGAAYLERRVTTPARDESLLAPVLRQIQRELPEVFLKSHATHFGPDVRMEVFASIWTADRTAGEALLDRAIARIRDRLGDAGPTP
jgi:molybdopterin-biosynthesis enzyme MoeA-like protein